MADRLQDSGAVVVSEHAIDQYLEQRPPAPDTPPHRARVVARKELTALVLDAHEIAATYVPGYVALERWRVRDDLRNLTLTVRRQGRLAIVTSIGKLWLKNRPDRPASPGPPGARIEPSEPDR